MMRQARQESSEAAAAAGEAALRDMTAQHHSSSGLAAVRDKARAVLDALRVLAKLALRTSAAMQTATASLQTASHAPSPQVSAAALLKYLYAWYHMVILQFAAVPSLIFCSTYVTAPILCACCNTLWHIGSIVYCRGHNAGILMCRQSASGTIAGIDAMHNIAVCNSRCHQIDDSCGGVKGGSPEALSVSHCRRMSMLQQWLGWWI